MMPSCQDSRAAARNIVGTQEGKDNVRRSNLIENFIIIFTTSILGNLRLPVLAIH